MNNIYLQNLMIISQIESKTEKDPVKIEEILFTLKQELETMKKFPLKDLSIWFIHYLEITSAYFLSPDFHTAEIKAYRQKIIACIKQLFKDHKYFQELYQIFLAKYENEEYTELSLLYTTYYFLVLSSHNRIYFINEMTRSLELSTRGINYAPGDIIEDPFKYTEEIDEGIKMLRKDHKC